MDRIKNMSVRIELDNFYCINFGFGSNRIFHYPDRIESKKCHPKNPDLIESNSKKSRVGSDQIGSDHPSGVREKSKLSKPSKPSKPHDLTCYLCNKLPNSPSRNSHQTHQLKSVPHF